MMDFNWSLPMFEDTDPGKIYRARDASLEHHSEVAWTALSSGFSGLLLGTGWAQTSEAFIRASALMARVPRIRSIVAVRPGMFTAASAAKMLATLDDQSQGRAALNVVSGGDVADLGAYGDILDHDARYERTAEFIECLRGLFGQSSFQYDGEHYQFRDAALPGPGWNGSCPPIMFGGTSEVALAVAARLANTYLMWGFPLQKVGSLVAKVSDMAQSHGRTVSFGLRINIIARRSRSDAWQICEHYARQAGTGTVRQKVWDSLGQRAMNELDGSVVEDQPLLWTGMSRIRPGSGTAIVGSYDEVAKELNRYVDLGIDQFILGAYPHLEECERVGNEVLSKLR